MEPSTAEGVEVMGGGNGAVDRRRHGSDGRREWSRRPPKAWIRLGSTKKWCRVPEARGPRINSWWSGLRACEQVDEGSIPIAPFSRESL